MTDSVKDLDVIATATDPLALARAAAELDLVESAGTPGEAGVRLRTHTGLQVDLRIVAPDQFGNLLQHFTGSKEHNMALRDTAVRKGLHVSEYGVLDDATGETHRCATEAEVYALLGLELHRARAAREPRRARGGGAPATLPELIELDDLRGDLHCHTTASDGTASIEEMAEAARDAGLRVPGDHRPLGELRLRRRRLAGAAPRAHRGDPRDRRSRGSSCWPAPRSTSCPTGRSTTTTSCWPSSTG